MFKYLKISHIIFSEIIKRAILQKACEKNSLVESIFNKIAGIDSGPATLLQRIVQQGGFPVNTSECSVLFEKV